MTLPNFQINKWVFTIYRDFLLYFLLEIFLYDFKALNKYFFRHLLGLKIIESLRCSACSPTKTDDYSSAFPYSITKNVPTNFVIP